MGRAARKSRDRGAEKRSIKALAERHGIEPSNKHPAQLLRELAAAGIVIPPMTHWTDRSDEGWRSRRAALDRLIASNVAIARGETPAPADEGRIEAFYKSWAWKRLSYQTRLDRGQRCECCGATPEHGVRIVCDHIKPMRRFWHLRLDPGNVQVLCDDCNMGKGSHDETDWRLPPRYQNKEPY